jgi:D-hydroxyproline dehydrogenase subunit alpha
LSQTHEPRGTQILESVTISRSCKTEVFACDYLASGFHLLPNVELQSLQGCKISGGDVQVDDFQPRPQTVSSYALPNGE